MFVSFSGIDRLDSSYGHPVDQLLWDLCQDTFGKQLLVPSSSGIYKLPELHKLDNVSGGHSSTTPQHGPIRVQIFHGRKVLIPDANDDDAHGEIRGVDDGIFCLVDVRYDAVLSRRGMEINYYVRGFLHMYAYLTQVCLP